MRSGGAKIPHDMFARLQMTEPNETCRQEYTCGAEQRRFASVDRLVRRGLVASLAPDRVEREPPVPPLRFDLDDPAHDSTW